MHNDRETKKERGSSVRSHITREGGRKTGPAGDLRGEEKGPKSNCPPFLVVNVASTDDAVDISRADYELKVSSDMKKVRTFAANFRSLSLL